MQATVDRLQQTAPCTGCGHSSEEEAGSDTSASEATTAPGQLQRLVIPEHPSGSTPGDSTQAGGSSWTSLLHSSGSGSVHSVDTAVLEAVAAAGAAGASPTPPSQGVVLPQPPSNQQPGDRPAASPPPGSSLNAADSMPEPQPCARQLINTQQTAQQDSISDGSACPLAGQQRSNSHGLQQQQQDQTSMVQQQQVTEQQQQAAGEGGPQSPYRVQLQELLSKYALLQKQVATPAGCAEQQRQQHYHRGLPPLPTTARQQQQHHQQQQQRFQVLQGLHHPAALPSPTAGLQQQHQQRGPQQGPQQANRAAALHQPQQQVHAAAAMQHQQQHQQAAGMFGDHNPQHCAAGSPVFQHHHHQQQLERALDLRDAPHQQQWMQQQLQQRLQMYCVPMRDRPWGWWRQPGGCSVLAGLDAVRPPLLQLHSALRDTHNSADLLAALGRTSPRQLQAAEAGATPDAAAADAAAGGAGAGTAGVWQQLLAVEAERQQLASPVKAAQAAPAGPQLPGHGRVLDLTCAGPAAAAEAAGGVEATAAAVAEAAAAEAAGLSASASAGGAAKAPKRPWQPKMAPDEHNWNEAAFTEVQASYSQGAAVPPGGKSGGKWPRTLPEHSTATFAQLMLLHGAGWPNHVLWEHWQAAHAPGSMAMFVHMKQGVSLSPGMPGRELIARTKLKVALDSRWGDISLVEATLLSCEEILKRCPHVQHIGLASGHDVPVQLIRPGLLLPGVSLFGLYQFGAAEMVTLKEAVVDELQENSALTNAEAHEWGNALTFHHQWMVLSREHAAALVACRREIMVIGRLLHKACCSVRAGMAPDEFIILTALKQRGFVRSVQRVEVKPHMRYPPGCMLNSYPTFVVFPAESSPHPVLWTHLDKKVRCQVERNTGEQYHTHLSLNDCLDLAVGRCAIFFRKIEIRQTRGEDLALLLSSLEAMWQGQRKGSTAALKTSSGSTGTGSKRRGNKRKKGQSNGATPQTSRDAAAEASPACSGAADGTTGSSAPPDPKKARASVEATS